MKTIFIFLISFFYSCKIFGQQETLSQPVSEQQLENNAASDNDEQTEDDSYLQELERYKKERVNINSAEANDLAQLHFLSAIQIQNLISYRDLLGKLINLYELQAVPGWDPATISNIRPYITVGNDVSVVVAVQKRFHGGAHTILVRYGQTLQRSAGYSPDPETGKNYYAGSPQKIFMRYRYQYKNLLQYGVSGEKDAGEQFFKGAQKAGFDFYSAHFFLRNAGIIRSLAIGDFSVNMGQGMIQWMSLAFKKSPDIAMIKREGDILRPYNSSGEVYFHRGAGVTLKKNRWQATVFGSYRKPDANFTPADSVISADDYVSSFQTSGYHRTAGEAADKGKQKQLCFGANISYDKEKVHAGINALQYQFKYPLIKKDEPYNLYALRGNKLSNYSADYSYTYKNFHFFGEAAVNNFKNLSSVNGLLVSVSARADLSLVYRNISKAYQSLYADAFTESSSPANEKGLFAGLSVRPSDQWRADAYTDFWRSPWLRYRVNAPSAGADHMFRLQYKPDKKLEIYLSYRAGNKPLNETKPGEAINTVAEQKTADFRIWLSYQLKKELTWRNRAEITRFGEKGPGAESGFLIYTEWLYAPPDKPWSGNFRLQYFETGGYNSRLCAYENDVLYAYTIPVFYDKGYHLYMNINYLINKSLSVWLKIAETTFPGKKSQSSGPDEIPGSKKTELKAQIMWKL